MELVKNLRTAVRLARPSRQSHRTPIYISFPFTALDEITRRSAYTRPLL